MKCENCGNDNLEGAKICAFCNQILDFEKSKQEIVNDKIDVVLNYNTDDLKASKKKSANDNSISDDDEYEYYDEYEEHVSTGGWMGIICLNLIPILGNLVYIILIFVWSFGGTKKLSLKNYARANLILFAIFALLGTALYFALNALGINLIEMGTTFIQGLIKN